MRIPKIGDHVYYRGYPYEKFHGYVVKVTSSPNEKYPKVWCRGWTEECPMRGTESPSYVYLNEITIVTPPETVIDKDYEELYD